MGNFVSKHSFDVISINETKIDFNTTDSEICITGYLLCM